MPLGISCCGIEMMALVDPRFDASRFGSEVMRFSPRQCDLLIVAGTTTYKMAKVVRKIYDQMPDPKWVIAMGVAPRRAECTGHIPLSRASISLCRSMSMSPVVRRARIICSMPS